MLWDGTARYGQFLRLMLYYTGFAESIWTDLVGESSFGRNFVLVRATVKVKPVLKPSLAKF